VAEGNFFFFFFPFFPLLAALKGGLAVRDYTGAMGCELAA
jgi:hypothetical protein